MTTKLFSELGLTPEILKAIDKLGFEQASPIQAEAIPPLMEGLDIVGQSQTGSGKTAAFAIPAVEKVDPNVKAVQVLVLAPTRELAMQVCEEVYKLALFKRGIHALPIYGGQSYDRQFFGLKQGAQIVVGTPGRIMDHMRRGTLRLDVLKMLVLDEADVMLDMGFREDIEFILQALPPQRQTVFFSATMPRPIQDLINRYGRAPRFVQIEQKAMTVPTVEQAYYEVDRRFKMEALSRLIDIHDYKLGIIFCNTKRMVDDLVDYLNAQGYSADRLHGDMSQGMRDRVMQKFRKSGLEFLVATDVAARGIDVDDVQVVFNYDLPYDPEDYVHRIGRTGRAGRSGRAISFVAGKELFQIKHIERFTRMRIQRGNIPSASEVEAARANAFLEKLRATLKEGTYPKQDHLVEHLLEEGFSSTDIVSAVLFHLQGAENAAAGNKGSNLAEERDFQDRQRGERLADREGRRDRMDRGGKFERKPRTFHDEPVRRLERDRSVPARPAPFARPEKSTAAASAKPSVSKEPAAPKPAEASAAAPAPAAKPPSLAGKKIPWEKRPAPEPAKPTKHSRATPGHQTRIYLNVGTAMGVTTKDVVGAILGETGLPSHTIGTVDLRERHTFVDVASEHANGIIAKLNRTRIKSNTLKVKIA